MDGRGTGVPAATRAGAYDAFISYSQRGDKAIAGALRSVIQTIGKPWWKLRNLNVFLDAASLSAAPGLWESIAGKLDASRYLILLASPEAAKSIWVDREVAHFVAGAGIGRLLIGLTGGDLAWDTAAGDFAWGEATPLPPSLRGRFREEPLWVDLRAFRAEPARATKSDQAFLHAALDLAATIKGVEKADLYSAELRQQRRNLRVAYGAAGVVAVLAVGAAAGAWIAVERAKEATRNFGIARETVDKIVADIVHDLRDVQGMRVESVQKILTTTQAALDRLYAIAPADAALRASRATTLVQIGDTYIAKGGNAGALAAYGESLAIRRALAAGSDDPERAAAVSESLSRVAYARGQAGDLKGAIAAYDESLAILAKLVAADPKSLDWQSRQAWDLRSKANQLVTGGDAKGGLALLAQSATLWRGLIAAQPGKPGPRNDLAWTLTNIGQAEPDRLRANAAFGEALALRRALYAEDKGNARAEDNVAFVLTEIATHAMPVGDLTGAAAALDEAESLRRHLVAVDPGNADWRNGLAATLRQLSNVDWQRGNAERSLARLEEAEAIFRGLARDDSPKLLWQENVADTLIDKGYRRLGIGEDSAAVGDFTEAVKWRRALVEASDGAGKYRAQLADGLLALGYGVWSLVDDGIEDGFGRVRSSYAEALAIYRALDASGESVAAGLATSLQRVGSLALREQDYGAAEQAFAEALPLREKLLALDATNVEKAGLVAAAHADIADVLVAKGDDAGALKQYEASLTIRRDIVAKAPAKESLRRDLALNLEKIAARKRRLGDTDGAIAAYREAIDLRRDLTDTTSLTRLREMINAEWKLQALLGNTFERGNLLSEVIDGLTEIDAKSPLNAADRTWLQTARATLADLNKILEKLEDELDSEAEAPAEGAAGVMVSEPGSSGRSD